ncbi:MAG TPA: DUF4199 domain-containing protein [Candidatus Nitrosotenuis sp.]|nr:DUF4199 domain-containing protein [Candidatus Nitrosotenuis sp.]
MKKTVLTYGLISGVFCTVMIQGTMPFLEKFSLDTHAIIGYTSLVLSTLLIYFGVRSYRDNVAGGRLTFGKGFVVGILIVLISSTLYVATWQVLYYKFMPDFMDRYAAMMIADAKASGASQEKIEETIQDTEKYKEMYKNPALVIALTYAEVFPIGLLGTLISAAILRRKTAPQEA